MRSPPFSIRSCTRRARRERHRAAPLRTARRFRCRYIGACRDGGSSPPPRTPEAPVHGGALLGLRRLEPLVGDLLLQGETFVLRVCLRISDVEAIAAVRIGVAVDQVPVLRLRHDLERRERAELLFSFW